MSLKQEIETWVEALARYDNNEFEESLKTFDNISDTSKILFNCGVIHATLGEHDKAVECYQRATKLDQYLAVAYFQQGVSNFLVGDFEEALANFNDTLLYLRGNTYIDYDQLGLKFKLFSCEVLFNRGLCYIYLQQKQAGMGDLSYAAKEKVTPDHEVIEEAIREEAEGYTVFSIPVGVLYRPNSAKVKNLKSKDYLGKARVIASVDRGNLYTGFSGTENKRPLAGPELVKDDRPPEAISFAASNLVRTDLLSRTKSRQQSEPPINRNMFPPTPPPESERPSFNNVQAFPASQAASLTNRANSVRNGSTRSTPSVRRMDQPLPPIRDFQNRSSEGEPPVLARSNTLQNNHMNMLPPLNTNLSSSSFSTNSLERPRIGTTRTASEPRGPTSKYSTARTERGQGPRGRLFMEATPTRDGAHPGSIEEYPDELYDLYRSTAHSNPYTSSTTTTPRPHDDRNRLQQQQRRSAESDAAQTTSPSTPQSSSLLQDFEMMNDAGGRMSRPREASRSRGTSRSRAHGTAEVRTLRAKVRMGDDTRYVMLSTTVAWEDFLDRVRDKLALRGAFKVKIKDDGDLITLGDRDDWDLCVQTARRAARKADDEMAKIEVWIQESFA